jgi:hypothetical protein
MMLVKYRVHHPSPFRTPAALRIGIAGRNDGIRYKIGAQSRDLLWGPCHMAIAGIVDPPGRLEPGQVPPNGFGTAGQRENTIQLESLSRPLICCFW